jgi:hypothetical protein
MAVKCTSYAQRHTVGMKYLTFSRVTNKTNIVDLILKLHSKIICIYLSKIVCDPAGWNHFEKWGVGVWWGQDGMKLKGAMGVESLGNDPSQ